MHFSRLIFASIIAAVMTGSALAAGDAPASVTLTMSPQNGSNESGTATLTQTGKDVQVAIDLQNAPAAAQPAHIHPGTCAKLDPAPKYPLSNVVNGKSMTTVKNAQLSDLAGGSFAINVHKSTDDLKTYVSCGDITMASPAPAASPMK